MYLSVRHLACCCFLGFALTGAAKAADPVKCRYGMISKLPLHYHGSGLQLVAQGQIDGTPAAMLIDTGASSTMLTRFATDKRKLRRDAGPQFATGIGGASRVFRVPIKHFQIGPISSDQRGTMFAYDETGSRSEVDAAVGSDFLMEFDMEISLAEKLLKFFSPANCERTFLGYWDPAAVVVPLLSDSNSKRPLVEVALNGVKMKALIDSGASGSFVSTAAASRAGVTSSSPGVQSAGEATGIGKKLIALHSASFETFAIGDEHIKHAKLRILDYQPDEFDVILGTDFLRAHRILFSVSQKKVYLSYIGGNPFHDDKSSPWIAQEAEAGNGYAQYYLATDKLKAGDDAARASGMQWMDKAVASKNPLALKFMARLHAEQGRYADSIALYEQVLALDAYDMNVQMETFLMRTKAGQPEQAKAGLAQGMAQFRWPPWPAPITEYYLGKIKLDELLREAGSDADVAKRRHCEVYRRAGALQEARGQAESAQALLAKGQPECGADTGR